MGDPQLAERVAHAEAGRPKSGEAILDSLSLDDFAIEERRVRRAAQASMGKSERLHLEAALDLQLRRVDAEWNAHEEQMHSDYESRRSEVEGR